MLFPYPLQPGRLVKRYKRFLADITLDAGEEITAYVANPGAMTTLKTPGSKVWVAALPEHVKRKLRFDWHLSEVTPGNYVGVNTSWPNPLVAEGLQHDRIPELTDYDSHKREVGYGQNSRIDFLLASRTGAPPCYLEVKNVNDIDQDGCTALFPDAKTARGTKHLQELTAMRQAGYRAVVLYVIQRMDCHQFQVADKVDPAYAQAALEARKSGVEFYAYMCKISTQEVTITRKVDVVL